MTTGSIGPGTVLAGRYRLDDLLTENAGARFWRATDTILARSVAIHAVPSDDPRSAGLLEASRVSATVVDSHLLRVLDCDDTSGITWVVNEWGDGISLDEMLQHGPLPASRAAWLAREVADAIAAGHAQGVAHGRLAPESVLVTHAGAVKLVGYVVDASLEPPREPDALYGELDDREADVINLAGILYAALTGRWPGVARSSVPVAPRESRRPLRPRQVRAGVPRPLDAICERVLNKEASRHAMPIETAHEIAAALADYVGDPSLSAPLDAAGMHAEPTVSLHRSSLPASPATAAGAGTTPETTGTSTGSGTAPDLEPVEEVAPEDAGGDFDPEATALFQQPDTGSRSGPESLSPLHHAAEPPSPPSPFEDSPERPLFASTERRVPAGSRSGQGPSSPWAQPDDGQAAEAFGADTGQADYWPFTGDTDDAEAADRHTGKEGRGWLRTAVVIGVLLILVVAMVIAFNAGRQGDTSPPRTDPGSSTSPDTSGKVIDLAGVRDFDPLADPPEENPESAPNAIDGDAGTSWQTSTYRRDPELGGLKAGVGLMVDLGSDTEVGSLEISLKGAPTSFEVYAAPAGVTASPGSLDELDLVAKEQEASEKATVELDPTPKTRYLLVWLTKLPAVSGGFRGEITDITVRS